MYTLTAERIMHAPEDIVWQVISDVEAYATYAPNIEKAIKTSEGKTPTRRCWDTQGRSWNEACVLWDEGHEYSYLIDTSPEDYPYPFTLLKGTWGIEATPNGTRVYMQFDYVPEQPLLLGWMVHLGTKRAFTPVLDEIFDNWQAEIDKRTAMAIS